MAEIEQTVGKSVAIAVARGDGPGSRVSQESRKREGYSTQKRNGLVFVVLGQPLSIQITPIIFLLYCCMCCLFVVYLAVSSTGLGRAKRSTQWEIKARRIRLKARSKK